MRGVFDMNGIIFGLHEHGGWCVFGHIGRRCLFNGGIDWILGDTVPWVHHHGKVWTNGEVVGTVDSWVGCIGPRNIEVTGEMCTGLGSKWLIPTCMGCVHGLSQ